jgi:hypothetical protein
LLVPSGATSVAEMLAIATDSKLFALGCRRTRELITRPPRIGNSHAKTIAAPWPPDANTAPQPAGVRISEWPTAAAHIALAARHVTYA